MSNDYNERAAEEAYERRVAYYENRAPDDEREYDEPSGDTASEKEAAYDYIAGLSDSELTEFEGAARSVRAARRAAREAAEKERAAKGAARYGSELAEFVAATLYLASGDENAVPISEQRALYAASPEASGLSFAEYLAGVGYGPEAAARFYAAVEIGYLASDELRAEKERAAIARAEREIGSERP